MKSFKQFLQEENKQGDIGTDKLTLHRKKLTPGEKPETALMLPEYEPERLEKE